MTNSDALRSAPVLRGHPVLVAPVVGVAVFVRAVDGVAAAQLAFLVAAGGVLVMELAAHLPLRAAWSRRLWLPSENEPAGLVPPVAGGVWALAAVWLAGRLDGAPAAALEAGVRACQVAIAIQLCTWLASMVRRRSSARGRRDAPPVDVDVRVLADHRSRRGRSLTG